MIICPVLAGAPGRWSPFSPRKPSAPLRVRRSSRDEAIAIFAGSLVNRLYYVLRLCAVKVLLALLRSTLTVLGSAGDGTYRFMQKSHLPAAGLMPGGRAAETRVGKV